MDVSSRKTSKAASIVSNPSWKYILIYMQGKEHKNSKSYLESELHNNVKYLVNEALKSINFRICPFT